MTPSFIDTMNGYFERMEKFLEVGNLASKYTLTIAEASIYTGLSTDKIRDAIKFGDLEAYKPSAGGKGRAILIRRKDLEGYIERHSLKIPKVRRAA